MNIRTGFTLLELSVVLVVMALLTGGIIGAREMIRSAELRSVTEQITSYRTAVNNFQTKYNAVPGDMKNATSYWGEANADAATCRVTIGSGKLTCNGNGDGALNTVDGGTTYHERFRFWQHLVNAGMIEGNYTGVAGGAGPTPEQQPVLGTNIPKAKIGGSGLSVIYQSCPFAGDADFFAGCYQNIFLFGGVDTQYSDQEALTPSEASSIDQKIDDGLPGKGMVVAYPSNRPITPNCTTTTSKETARYNATTDTVLCSLRILFTGTL